MVLIGAGAALWQLDTQNRQLAEQHKVIPVWAWGWIRVGSRAPRPPRAVTSAASQEPEACLPPLRLCEEVGGCTPTTLDRVAG
jgi:hypothetical protein